MVSGDRTVCFTFEMHLVDRTSFKFKIILMLAAIILICSKSFTPI